MCVTEREANLTPLILWPLYRLRIRVWQVAAFILVVEAGRLDREDS